VDHDLWPARGVAEHAYCPRLFYYMTVEGVFAPSADTEQGKGNHRRVDRPSEAPPPVEATTSKRPNSKKTVATPDENQQDVEPWQYSVFYCTLKAIDRVRLENDLKDILNLKVDQVLIVDLGGNEEAARESSAFLGAGVPQQEGGTIVI